MKVTFDGKKIRQSEANALTLQNAQGGIPMLTALIHEPLGFEAIWIQFNIRYTYNSFSL